MKIAERVGTTWMTVVPGVRDPHLDDGFQTENLVEVLQDATNILSPHGPVMVLESINTRRDHSTRFLTHKAYQICRGINRSACKVFYGILGRSTA